MDTLLLDQVEWDLVLDANGNIAVAEDPYSMAQDAASEIRTFQGEVFWDTRLGCPLLQSILGQRPSPAVLKSIFNTAAQRVPGVLTAQTFLTALVDRRVEGQVQITSEETGQVSAVPFAVMNPQGA